MADKPAMLFLACELSFPGSWGASDRGVHSAIAEACDEGASRYSAFVVYEAYEGCRVDEMGRLVWLKEHGEPQVDGIYDAAARQIGDSLKDASEALRKGYYDPNEQTLDPKQIKRIHEAAARLDNPA